MSISEDALQWGKVLADPHGAGLSSVLNSALSRFIGGDYKAVAGCVVDLDGRKSASFASVIHKASACGDPTDPCDIPLMRLRR